MLLIQAENGALRLAFRRLPEAAATDLVIYTDNTPAHEQYILNLQ